MGKEPDSWSDNWIEAAPFDWTPETPLRDADAAGFGEARPEPRFVEPRFIEPRLAEPRFAEPATDIPAPIVPETRRESFSTTASAQGPSLLLPRLLAGLAQGLCLSLLLAARSGMPPALYAAAVTAFLFAPLCLLLGIGRIASRPLLLWTFCAGAALAAAGVYHQWRNLGAETADHPGFILIALCGLFLFIGQALMQAGGRAYPAHHDAAWRLVIRVTLCVLMAGIFWALIGAGAGWLRENPRAAQYMSPAALQDLTLPLVALGMALAAHLTGERFLAALQSGLVFVCLCVLPFVLLLGLATAGMGAMAVWHPGLSAYLILGIALILGINASYGDGTHWRASWRRRCEFLGALLLLPLAMLAGMALAARTGEWGWTVPRIFAAASILMLAGYGLCYAGAALIGLGGGGWMARIETGNLAMAFAAMALIAALLSPLADPARLAVAAQSLRLESGLVRPDLFDFDWLRQGGARFGHDALLRLAQSRTRPQIARGAFQALAVPVRSERPAPTEIGANIHLHGAGALPAGILAQNWSAVAGAPPCLTGTAVACDAFFTDLDGDGQQELLLLYGRDPHWWAGVLRQDGPGWRLAGTLAGPSCAGALAALRAGHFTLIPPRHDWRDLLVNGLRLSVTPAAPDPMACPAS